MVDKNPISSIHSHSEASLVEAVALAYHEAVLDCDEDDVLWCEFDMTDLAVCE